MKKVLLVLALMGLAIPVSAQENPCITIEVDHGEGWPRVASRDYQGGAPSASIEGHFLVVSWADNPTAEVGFSEALSFEADNLASAVACADGSVTLVEIESDAGDVDFPPAPSPAPDPEPVTLRPVCDVHGDTLIYTCTLPNLTLTIS